MLSTIVGANHFCRMSCVCVVTIPNFSKVPLISLLIWACAFYSIFVMFSIQMQYNIQSAIYTSRNCLHIIRPWFRDCCSSPFYFVLGLFFFFWVYLCQCHESSCHLLMSPLCLYCVELLVNVYCDVLNLNSWFKTL